MCEMEIGVVCLGLGGKKWESTRSGLWSRLRGAKYVRNGDRSRRSRSRSNLGLGLGLGGKKWEITRSGLCK